MKNKQITALLTIILLGLLISGCTGTSASNSWGGVSVSTDKVLITNSTTVVALNAKDDSFLWKYPDKAVATRLFYAAPAISDGTGSDQQAIIGDYSGLLVSINMNWKAGDTENWKFAKAQGKYIGSALIDNEKQIVVAPNTDGFLYFIKMKKNETNAWVIDSVTSFPQKSDSNKSLDSTGLSGPALEEFWAAASNTGIDKNALGAFWATPVSDGTTVYAPNTNHKLYAIDIATNKLKWNPIDLGGPMVGPVLLDNGVLYLGTLNSTLYALNSDTGAQVWSKKLTGGIWSAPILKDGLLYVGDESGTVTILDSKTGEIKFTPSAGSSILGSGVVVGEKVVFGTEAGEILAFDANGTSAKWPATLTGKFYSNLVYFENHLYVLATKGDATKPFYIFNTDGTLVNFDFSVIK
jgi:outer membrane protein assembly factor BamB